MAAKPKPKPKPAPKPDTCRLVVMIRGEPYLARPVRGAASDVARAWRLRKPDGTSYVVADTADGATCECASFEFRHKGNDQAGCKHTRALRALGLIDDDGAGPAEWPAWTDTHAYTTARR